jgi:general secretion pathway protein H
MLVALVIAAVLAGTLMLAVPDRSRSLRYEADRLARLMAVAREEAILRGAPVRFETDGERFRFVVWLDRAWQPLVDDPALRERVWLAPTTLTLERADGQRVIEFGREQVDVPFRLRLARDGAQAVITANGLGGFALD